MPKKIIIRNEQIRNRALEIIRKIPFDPITEIIIKPFKEIRSLAQNALYWKWLTIIGADLGSTKDELHEEFKEKFCLPIMIKNPDDYPEICEIVESIQAVRDAGMNEKADQLYKLVCRLVSTTKLKTKHMTEYMNDIERHVNSMNIYLPHPEDQSYMEY